MIPRDSLINKLRALGYSYKDQQKRTDLYRKRGGTDVAFVPRTPVAHGTVCSVRFTAGWGVKIPISRLS